VDRCRGVHCVLGMRDRMAIQIWCVEVDPLVGILAIDRETTAGFGRKSLKSRPGGLFSSGFARIESAVGSARSAKRFKTER